MNSKDSLSEDEFKKLIELLSKRRDQFEGRVTISFIKESLRELGLLHLLSENDIKEVRRQVSRDFPRQQRYFPLIPIIITAALAGFGGYKLKEYLDTSVSVDPSALEKLEKKVEELQNNKVQLEVKLENYQQTNNLLETGNNEFDEKVKELENTKVQLEVELKNYQQTNEQLKTENERLNKELKEFKNNPSPRSSVESIPRNSSQGTYKINGFRFELQSCKKTNVNSGSQSINCTLLITSTEKNATLSLYDGWSSPRSRMVEAGTIYLATKVQLGTSSRRYRATENLIKDVPIKAYITFDRVSLEVNKIQVMEILLRSGNIIRLEFRDVPLSEY